MKLACLNCAAVLNTDGQYPGNPPALPRTLELWCKDCETITVIALWAMEPQQWKL